MGIIPYSQDVPEPRPGILIAHARLFRALLSEFLVEPVVLVHENVPEPQRQKPVKYHKARAHPHAHAIVRRVGRRVDACSEERTTLPNEIQDNDAHTAACVRALVVEHPGQDVGDTGEDTCGGEEDAGVPRSDSRCGGEQNVSDGADQREDDDGEATLLGAVGDVCGDDNDDSGEEVRRRGETLRVNGAKAHFGQDSRKEDREGREGDIAREIHERGEVVLSPSMLEAR